jgi:hypothetical protein
MESEHTQEEEEDRKSQDRKEGREMGEGWEGEGEEEPNHTTTRKPGSLFIIQYSLG